MVIACLRSQYKILFVVGFHMIRPCLNGLCVEWHLLTSTVSNKQSSACTACEQDQMLYMLSNYCAVCRSQSQSLHLKHHLPSACRWAFSLPTKCLQGPPMCALYICVTGSCEPRLHSSCGNTWGCLLMCFASKRPLTLVNVLLHAASECSTAAQGHLIVPPQ